MSFEAPEIFYKISDYYLRELLGYEISFLDIDFIAQVMSISEEDLNVILNDEKLQDKVPFYTLYPLFKKVKFNKDTKELDSKYWKLLKDKKLPTDFSTNSKEDVIYWLGSSRENKEATKEELEKILSEKNQKFNLEQEKLEGK